MKTNNIFISFLLIAIALLWGGKQAKATVFYNDNAGTQYVEFPFGSFDNEPSGSVLRVTYVIEPQNGWTPTYKITFASRAGTIFEQTVTENGTIDIPLEGYNKTDQYNICAYLNGEWVKFKKLETVSAGTTTTKKDITLTFNKTSVEVGMNQTFTTPTLTAKSGSSTVRNLSYTYTSSDTNVAIVSNSGSVTLKGVGTTTITASFSGNNTYNSATASYTLTVVQTYKLTFILDNDVFRVQYYKAGERIYAPTTSYKSGYIFDGWLNLPRDMPSHDLVIYGTYSKSVQEVTVSVGSTMYATYCTIQPLKILGTEDIKVYVAKSVAGTQVKLTQVIGTVAPGTGLLLKGGSRNVSAKFETCDTGESYDNNLLVGVQSAEAVNSADDYVLVSKDDVAKFADTRYAAATVPAGKAYLHVPSNGSRMLSITFEDDETTGITNLQTNSELASPAYYNVGGQRVANPTKGLYIVNGKKIIIK